MDRFIFLRIAWMKHYKGVTGDDIPVGAGSYVTEHDDGGEVSNFYRVRGRYYGYARIQGEKSLRLERLGASKTDKELTDVTVVFFAKNPYTKGQYIVGWYKHATLFKYLQFLGDEQRQRHPEHLTFTATGNAYLVPDQDRLFEVPDESGGPGQSNAWYVEEYHVKGYLREVVKYLDDPENYVFRKAGRGSGWQRDVERRQKIEFAAMKTVAEYFERRNYIVIYRHTENLGWDMEATSGKQTLLLEVKGLSGDLIAVDFTPNEFENCKRNRRNYRICVVSQVLKSNQQLNIFFNETGKWVNQNGGMLIANVRQSARFVYNP
jgi:hypothetical protein